MYNVLMAKKKTKNHQKRNIALVVIALVLLSAIGYVIYWIVNNTAFLSGKLNQQQLNSNNQNQLSAPFKLVPQMVGGKELFAPEGFKISIYSTGIKGARFFAFAPDGTMFVGSNTGDSIYAIPNNNGSAGTPVVIEDNLNTPHSVYYYNGDLYLAEQIRVSVYRGIKSDGTYNSKEVLVDNLPGGNKLTGGGHTTRTVVIGPDNKMYVSVGSSCNVCIEDDNRRATIMRYNLDGTGGEIYASGLRNTVGFSFNDGKLWGLDMGRDQIGDDIPPEEVNIIEQGKNYGWPYCYGDKINNPEYKDKAEYCKTQTQAPVLGLQAHYAPLGIAFENEAAKASWPSVFSGGFFGAMHGSWNRTVPTGYKVIWVDTKSSPMKEYNFITGWLDGSGAWGRPVGVGFDPAGNMYISDDKQNLIYKVQYQ
jgi:glucose/arabinose dehydrogenase